MTRETKAYHIGDAAITRIDELTLAAFQFGTLYPGAEPQALERHRGRLDAGSLDPETGTFIQSIHHARLG